MADWREIVPDAPLSQISQTVPNPGDVFTRREIAKANRDIQMLRRKARQLPKKHLKACEAWYENIRSELERAGYFRAIELRDRLHEEFVAERERSAQIRTRLEADTLDEVTRDDLLLDLDDLRQQSQAI